MALKICKVCGNRINAKAKKCRYCALTKQEMPVFVKYEIAALVLLFVVMMAAARNVPQLHPVEPSAAQPVVQEPAPPAGMLFNIPKIAGKTQAEVEVLLGEPVFCSKAESVLNCSFQDNEIDIVFIDGKADWITVNGTFRNPSYSQKLEGKTKAEILKLLGDPVFCVRTKSKSALNCSFKDGNVSVEFIDGKVEEVNVKGSLGKAPYSKDTLELLGLQAKDATFSNERVMRWDNIQGLLSVTLYSEEGIVSLATVKAKTK